MSRPVAEVMAAAPCVLNIAKTSAIDGEVRERRGHTWGGPQVIGLPAPSVSPAQELGAPDEWRSEVVTQAWLEHRYTTAGVLGAGSMVIKRSSCWLGDPEFLLDSVSVPR